MCAEKKTLRHASLVPKSSQQSVEIVFPEMEKVTQHQAVSLRKPNEKMVHQSPD